MHTIQIAKAAEAAEILSIYAPYIKNTSLTFEIEVPTINEFAERIEKYLSKWPWLVAKVDGKIVGYAYASSYRERKAYEWSVECSVYVHDDHHRKGIAKILYTALFEILKKQGFRNVYAVINLPNDNSVAFHESMGFNYFATYEKVGYKFGQWKNVGWWRLVLNDFEDEPAYPISFKNFDKKLLPEILNRNF